MRRLYAVVFLLLTSACTAQQYAGIGQATIYFGDDGQVSLIRTLNGKEHSNIAVRLTQSSGTTISIEADHIASFEGQEIRAELAQVLLEEGVEPTTELVEMLIELLFDS